jgi:hypothetical protein
MLRCGVCEFQLVVLCSGCCVACLDKNKFGKISASVGFIKKKFVTMHGHMNVKFLEELPHASQV